MSKLSGWLWSTLEFVLAVLPLFVGYRLILWAMAKPIGRLPAHVSLPSGCPAFRYDHNLYLCEPLGTTQSQPVLFAGFVITIVACFAVVAWIYLSGRSERTSLVQRVIAATKVRRHSA